MKVIVETHAVDQCLMLRMEGLCVALTGETKKK